MYTRAKQKEQILVAIPSFYDPYLPGKPAELGNIGTLLKREIFQEVFMFGLDLWKLNAFLTEQYIVQYYPQIRVSKKILPITNVSSYKEIFYVLKQALDDQRELFTDKKRNVSFLLPPSFCDKLLDCWLLLLTSLNSKARIYQIEPHYSLDATASEGLWNKSFDWMGNGGNEVREWTEETETKISNLRLAPQLIRKLKPLTSSKKPLLILGKSQISDKVDQFIRQNSSLNCSLMRIECEELPSEICDDILFGYHHTIEDEQVIQKDGLLNRGQSGIIHVSKLDRLPMKTQDRIATLLEESSDTTGIRFMFSIPKSIWGDSQRIHHRLRSQLQTIEAQ